MRYRLALAALFVAVVSNVRAQVVDYATYITSEQRTGSGVAVDSAGNVYVIAHRVSNDVPSGCALTKVNAAGNMVVYDNYLGDQLDCRAIAVDGSNNVFVAGTATGGVPVTSGAYQTILHGSSDGFLIKYAPSGSIVYASYLGGSGTDAITALAVDTNGNAWVSGTTSSNDLPLSANAMFSGAYGAFVAKVSSTGSALAYSTYWPGGAPVALAVDSAGGIYLSRPAGDLTKLDSTKLDSGVAAIVYSASIGNNFAVAVSAAGNVSGVTATIDTYSLGGNYYEYDVTWQMFTLNGAGEQINIVTWPVVHSEVVESSSLNTLWSGKYWAVLDGANNLYVAASMPLPGISRASGLIYPASIYQDGGVIGTLVMAVAPDGTALYATPVAGYIAANDWNWNLCNFVANSPLAVSAAGDVYLTGCAPNPSGYAGGPFPLVNPINAASNTTRQEFLEKLASQSAAALGFFPGTLDFGPVEVGANGCYSETLEVVDMGASALNVTSAVTTGDFSVYTNDCGAVPSSGCLITLCFAPTGMGARAGTLTISSNAGVPAVVQLSGLGTAPQSAVSLSSNSVSFPPTLPGETGLFKTVTLTNTGTIDLSISRIAITGSNASDFSETNDCGNSVAVGQHCQIKVYFTPAAPGVRTATLSIYDSAPDSPQQVALSGAGSGPPTSTTQAAAAIQAATATLNGAVNPNGAATSAWFEYGISNNLGTYSSTDLQPVGLGTSDVSVDADLTGLAANTTYYFRVAASNTNGTTRGSILSFSTPPSVTDSRHRHSRPPHGPANRRQGGALRDSTLSQQSASTTPLTNSPDTNTRKRVRR